MALIFKIIFWMVNSEILNPPTIQQDDKWYTSHDAVGGYHISMNMDYVLLMMSLPLVGLLNK